MIGISSRRHGSAAAAGAGVLLRDYVRRTGIIGVCLSLLIPGTAADERPAADKSALSGIVLEGTAGVADVPVCLCDGVTGKPLTFPHYQPMTYTGAEDFSRAAAIVLTDERGQFRFTEVPAGNYRLVAQKWTGPWKGLFELHGSVVQLFGSANDVQLPLPQTGSNSQVVLRPPGTGIVQFDQQVGNDETLLLLSAAPPAFDPILGFHALDNTFWLNLQGMNRMPGGRTTIIGVPDVPLYAFFFAADNSPGFAAASVPPSGGQLVRQEPEAFIAAWSDGKRKMPVSLQKLSEFMDRKKLRVQQLLALPGPDLEDGRARAERISRLTTELFRVIPLAEERTARVGDLLAIEAYRRLQETTAN